MRLSDLEKLEKAAFTTKLKPGEIKVLGADVQVWAVRVFGVVPTSKRATALLPVAVGLYNGEQEIFISAGEFLPAEDSKDKYSLADLQSGKAGRKKWAGIPLEEFTRVIYSHLPHTTKKSRVVLVSFDSAQNYGALEVHTLDSRVSFIPSGASGYSLKFLDKKAGRNLEFIDLSSFFPGQTVAEIARDFGVSAGKVPEPTKKQAGEELRVRAYVRNEIHLTWNVLQKARGVLLEKWGVDPIIYNTAARAAARVYVAHYLEKEVGLVRKQIRTQALLSYWGGRVEAFRRGEQRGKIAIYDAVSLYANSCIKLGALPRDEDWYRLTAQNLRTCTGGICTVEFEFSPEELHPCLPVEAGGQIYYPLKGVSHCTAHEARYALECGARVELVTGWGYDIGDTSLSRYSADLLTLKNEAEKAGDKTARAMYKILLNSLYGKFAQNTVDYDLETLRQVCRELNLPSLHALDKIGESGWLKMLEDEQSDFLPKVQQKKIHIGSQWCPEWTSLINGYARYIESRAMREYVALAGTTDSVIIPADLGEEFFIDGIRFKREAVGDMVKIARARLYVLTDGGRMVREKVTLKYVSGPVVKAALHGAPDVAGMPELLAAWQGEDTLEIPAPRVTKLREGLNGGLMVGKGSTKPQTTRMHWDNKRMVLGDYSLPYLEVSSNIDPATGEALEGAALVNQVDLETGEILEPMEPRW